MGRSSRSPIKRVINTNQGDVTTLNGISQRKGQHSSVASISKGGGAINLDLKVGGGQTTKNKRSKKQATFKDKSIDEEAEILNLIEETNSVSAYQS